MLIKTHLAVGVLLLLVFLPHSMYKLIFIPVILIASILPDIDTGFSTIGKHGVFRILQWFTKHRGIIHSFSLCIAISILFGIFYPPAAFPFFLGYGIHLLMDSFTVEGIRPFWPLNDGLNGKITTGGNMEYLLFVVFVIIDLILFIGWFVK